MQELEWVSSHPEEAEKYSGMWVALTKDGIVAAGDSVSEVKVILEKKGIALGEIMLMKVPRKDEDLSIL